MHDNGLAVEIVDKKVLARFVTSRIPSSLSSPAVRWCRHPLNDTGFYRFQIMDGSNGP